MPTYYHASTEKFDVLVPRYSRKFRKYGIFIALSKKSILDSWGDYVLGKRTTAWTTARKEKLRGRDTARQKKNQDYSMPEGSQTLYLYKISIPHDLEKMLTEAHQKKVREEFEKNGVGTYGAWGWDEELFVPAEHVKELRIDGRKEMTALEFENWKQRQEQRETEMIYPKALGIKTKPIEPASRSLWGNWK